MQRAAAHRLAGLHRARTSECGGTAPGASAPRHRSCGRRARPHRRAAARAAAPPPGWSGTNARCRRPADNRAARRAGPPGGDETPARRDRRPLRRRSCLHQRVLHLCRLAQDVACIVIAHGLPRFVERMPDTRGDPFGFFRYGLAAPRFEEKEVTVLVNRLAAETEIPIDHLDRPVEYQLVEAGFLRDFAPRRLGRRLTGLEVSLGESPILVRVTNQEKPNLPVGPAAEYDATRARLALGAGLGLAGLGATTRHENSECEMRNAEFLK